MMITQLMFITSVMWMWISLTRSAVVMAQSPQGKASVGTNEQGQLLFSDNSSSITLATLISRLSAAEARLDSQQGTITAQQNTITAQQSSLDALLQQAVFAASGPCSYNVSNNNNINNNLTLTQRLNLRMGTAGLHYFRIATTTATTTAAGQGTAADFDHFLALGNSDGSDGVPGVIFKFDVNIKQFVIFQNLTSTVVFDWESFVMNGRTYLLQVSAGNPSGTSVLLVYNGTRFNVAQTFSLSASYSAKFFSINGSDYNIVFTNGLDTNDPLLLIYRFSGTAAAAAAGNGTFTLWKSLASGLGVGLFDVETFVIGSTTYLMTSSDNTGAVLYRYNAATDTFVTAQTFSSSHATTVKFFSFNGQSFVAMNERYANAVEIFKWNNTAVSSNFQLLQTVPAACTYQSAFFKYAQDYYLAVSQEYTGTCFNSDTLANSQLLKFNGTQFIPSAYFQTRGSCQIAAFTINGAAYIASSGASFEADSTTGRVFQLTKAAC